MSQEVLYVGVDVGCEQLWASCEGGRPQKFTQTKKGIRALYAWSQKHGPSRPVPFCMEATGVYSLSVASRLLGEHHAQVSIVNPARIAAYGRVEKPLFGSLRIPDCHWMSVCVMKQA